MRRQNRYTAYYAFITPYLESGDTAAIENAKKEYRRMYKSAWRKAQRKKTKHITLIFGKDEYKALKHEAKRHKESITRFIQKAAEGYMLKRYVVPDEKKVDAILQRITLTYNSIGEMRDEALIGESAEKKLEAILFQLEKEIRVYLMSPKTIEQSICDVLRQSPSGKQSLITYIETLPI